MQFSDERTKHMTAALYVMITEKIRVLRDSRRAMTSSLDVLKANAQIESLRWIIGEIETI